MEANKNKFSLKQSMEEEKSIEAHEESIEELREQKIQEIVDKRIEAKKDEIKEEARRELERVEARSKTSSTSSNEGISRRQFLKKAGIGTVGLAALGLAPASALKIRSNEFSVSTGSNSDITERINIEGGNLNLVNDTGVDANNNDIGSVGELVAEQVKAQQEMNVPQKEPDEKENGQLWIDTERNRIGTNIDGERRFAKLKSPRIHEMMEGGSTLVLDQWEQDHIEMRVQNERSVAGSYSLEMRGTSDRPSGIRIDAEAEFNRPRQPEVVAYSYWETSSICGWIMGFYDENDEVIFKMGHDNPEKILVTGDTEANTYDPSTSYETWRRMRAVIDWDNNSVDIHMEDIENREFTDSDMGESFVNNADGIKKITIESDDEVHTDQTSTITCSDDWGNAFMDLFVSPSGKNDHNETRFD